MAMSLKAVSKPRAGTPALESPALVSHAMSFLLPGRDEVGHAAHVMLWLAHVGEAGPPGALGPAPDNVDSDDGRGVDLVPHLDGDTHELAAEEHSRVNAAAADGDADTGEGLARASRHEEDVTDLGGVGLVAVEEAGAGAGRVEGRQLLRR